jgi:hypothetical protein
MLVVFIYSPQNAGFIDVPSKPLVPTRTGDAPALAAQRRR